MASSLSDVDSPRAEEMIKTEGSEELDTNDASVVEPEDPLYETDEFRMYCFKVLPCDKRYPHDWLACPYTHPGEKAKRRDPRLHQAVTCPGTKRSGKCSRGTSCPYAHGVFELWLHPARYRTQMCTDGTDCTRKVCFFAHTPEQLRAATPATETMATHGHASDDSCSTGSNTAAASLATDAHASSGSSASSTPLPADCVSSESSSEAGSEAQLRSSITALLQCQEQQRRMAPAPEAINADLEQRVAAYLAQQQASANVSLQLMDVLHGNTQSHLGASAAPWQPELQQQQNASQLLVQLLTGQVQQQQARALQQQTSSDQLASLLQLLLAGHTQAASDLLAPAHLMRQAAPAGFHTMASHHSQANALAAALQQLLPGCSQPQPCMQAQPQSLSMAMEALSGLGSAQSPSLLSMQLGLNAMSQPMQHSQLSKAGMLNSNGPTSMPMQLPHASAHVPVTATNAGAWSHHSNAALPHSSFGLVGDAHRQLFPSAQQQQQQQSWSTGQARGHPNWAAPPKAAAHSFCSSSDDEVPGSVGHANSWLLQGLGRQQSSQAAQPGAYAWL